ncbi:ABC transporter ATP-binding protein [Paenibacillus cymbidii]|uniref:ABC transporter ATP-binding protein n=1 Tax=Paenibacillus cymbidii TaxID=1639034 RepID=UPI00108117D6|nr:ABC transporter ATP-binding protein [Paenibacillus cymbidii]
MRKLTRFLKPYWLSSVLAPLLMVLEVCMDLLQPALIASIVDDGIAKHDFAHIRNTGLLMIGVALVGLIGGAGCTLFSSIASQRFAQDVRNRLYEKVQSLSFRNLDQLQQGSLITRLTNDVTQLQTFVQMTLRTFVRFPLLVIGSLTMTILISLRLSPILAVAIPLLALFLTLLIRRSFPLFRSVQAGLDRVNNVLQENLSGIRVVKAFVRAPFERKRFEAANGDYTKVATKAGRILALNQPVLGLIMNASVVAVLWFGGQLTRDGDLPVGDLIAYLNYVTQLLSAMLMLGMMLSFVSRAKASADRVNEVFAAEPDIQDSPAARDGVIREGAVEFRDVSFAYAGAEGAEALRGVSFAVRPGETLAVLGATGSGKTSLVQLIPRLYDAEEGAVLIDGTDVRDIRLDHLRAQIGMVLQATTLFSGTIRDNIRFGKPDATDAEVEEAARAAEAHEFIARMPEGYDSQLGQRGVNLSGGQKQRVAIARALLLKPRILILDDSTSAVDPATEARIRASLRTIMRGSTNILIAQRISSVADADRILVLEDGAIAAEGTHQSLLRDSEIYREIYRSQVREGDNLHVG